jgi:hypothetical protein
MPISLDAICLNSMQKVMERALGWRDPAEGCLAERQGKPVLLLNRAAHRRCKLLRQLRRLLRL